MYVSPVISATGDNVGLTFFVKTLGVGFDLHALWNTRIVLIVKNNNFWCVSPALSGFVCGLLDIRLCHNRRRRHLPRAEQIIGINFN